MDLRKGFQGYLVLRVVNQIIALSLDEFQHQYGKAEVFRIEKIKLINEFL
jgi:hypothetical protein